MRDASVGHDVFISYAHIDNQTLSEGQEGWITTLHRALEIRLAQLLGEPPKIWRDRKLQGNDYFDDEICSNLSKAFVLVAVMSPRYVRSVWCNREIKEFLQGAARSSDVPIENKSRIFKVIKTPIPLEEHPVEVQGLLGYEFFHRDSETQRFIEFNRVLSREVEHKFWAQL
jgi:TIR domain